MREIIFLIHTFDFQVALSISWDRVSLDEMTWSKYLMHAVIIFVLYICLQFKYLYIRPCRCTQLIYYIQPIIIFLPFRKYYNQFVYLFVSRSGNITTPLLVPLYVLFLWCWVYLIHFLCCFTRSNDKLYIWLTPSPHFGLFKCVYLLFCNIWHLLQYHFTQCNWHLLHELQTNYLHAFFFHLSLHFNRKLRAVVVVIVW